MLHELRVTLAVTLLALAAVSAVDSASADWFDDFEAGDELDQMVDSIS